MPWYRCFLGVTQGMACVRVWWVSLITSNSTTPSHPAHVCMHLQCVRKFGLEQEGPPGSFSSGAFILCHLALHKQGHRRRREPVNVCVCTCVYLCVRFGILILQLQVLYGPYAISFLWPISEPILFIFALIYLIFLFFFSWSLYCELQWLMDKCIFFEWMFRPLFSVTFSYVPFLNFLSCFHIFPVFFLPIYPRPPFQPALLSVTPFPLTWHIFFPSSACDACPQLSQLMRAS